MRNDYPPLIMYYYYNDRHHDVIRQAARITTTAKSKNKTSSHSCTAFSTYTTFTGYDFQEVETCNHQSTTHYRATTSGGGGHLVRGRPSSPMDEAGNGNNYIFLLDIIIEKQVRILLAPMVARDGIVPHKSHPASCVCSLCFHPIHSTIKHWRTHLMNTELQIH